jgi:hypothetical protein
MWSVEYRILIDEIEIDEIESVDPNATAGEINRFAKMVKQFGRRAHGETDATQSDLQCLRDHVSVWKSPLTKQPRQSQGSSRRKTQTQNRILSSL